MSKSILPPRYQARSRYYRILEEISAGDLFIGFLSSAGSTKLLYKTAHARARARHENKRALMRLEQCGFVRRNEKRGVVSYIATKEGRGAVHSMPKYALEAIRRQKQWDKLWRIVAYDFPEQQRSHRNALRYVLEKIGFLQIQKSVWIFPYDISLLSDLFARDTIIHNHTLYMEVRKISLDSIYRKHFKLIS